MEAPTTTTTEQTIQNDDKIKEEGLGFLIRKGKIKIAKSLEKYKFALSLPSISEIEKIEITLGKIEQELDKISNIPAIKERDKQHHKDLYRLWHKTVKTKMLCMT